MSSETALGEVENAVIFVPDPVYNRSVVDVSPGFEVVVVVVIERKKHRQGINCKSQAKAGAIPEEVAIGVGRSFRSGHAILTVPPNGRNFPSIFLSLLPLLREHVFLCCSSIFLFSSYSHDLSQMKTEARNLSFNILNY